MLTFSFPRRPLLLLVLSAWSSIITVYSGKFPLTTMGSSSSSFSVGGGSVGGGPPLSPLEMGPLEVGPLSPLGLEVKNITVGYMGAPGSFTEDAVVTVFEALHLQIRVTPSPAPAPEQNIAALLQHELDYIMVPVYNSHFGAVHREVLQQFSPQIEALPLDIVIPIRLDLMVFDNTVELSDLRVIKSHPAALAESADFIQHLANQDRKQGVPAIRTEAASSTSAAAKEVEESKNRALGAVASSRAAAMYNLHILQKDVQSKGNATRFLLLKRGRGILLEDLLAYHQLDTVDSVLGLQGYTTDQATQTVLADIQHL